MPMHLNSVFYNLFFSTVFVRSKSVCFTKSDGEQSTFSLPLKESRSAELNTDLLG